MALALDGSAAYYGDVTGDNYTQVTLTTTAAGGIIVAICYNSATITLTSITDTAGLTYSKLAGASVGNNNNNYLELWGAIATGGHSGNVITVNYSGVPDFATVHAFGISDAVGLDTNAGLPVIDNSGTADPLSISTDGATSLIVAAFRMSSTANPSAGSGFTEILGSSGSGYTLTEYKLVTSPQSGLSVPIGTGSGDSNVGIATAVVATAGTTTNVGQEGTILYPRFRAW